jgi:DNA-3-methyladenine glycosylase I
MHDKKRCFGGPKQERYTAYHDSEWGQPSHNDNHLFEMLVLSGAQAGISWDIVFNKRAAYHEAFHQFDPVRVADMTNEDLDKLLEYSTIIRNKLKVYSARQNARAVLRIQQECGSFSKYLWKFVEGKPIVNHWTEFKEVPTASPLSIRLSKDLKARGISFIGPISAYSYMQSVGMIDDHLVDCWLREGTLA